MSYAPDSRMLRQAQSYQQHAKQYLRRVEKNSQLVAVYTILGDPVALTVFHETRGVNSPLGIVAKTGISREDVLYHVKELERVGLVERSKSDIPTVWDQVPDSDQKLLRTFIYPTEYALRLGVL